jgi:hypothetical protein
LSNRSSILSKLKRQQSIFLGLILGKTVCFLLLTTVLARWSDYDESRATGIREGWFPPAQAQWLERQQTGWQRHFTTWDAGHYLVLSEAGYFKELRACAFYPLWPWTVRMGVQVSGASPIMIGMVLANVFSLVGWWLFWRNTGGRFGDTSANWALVFLVAFPGSLFYQFIYSEAQFFLLLMLLWRGLETRSYSSAWLAAFLLPLSRAVGLFVVLPILWHAWERWGERWDGKGGEGSVGTTAGSFMRPWDGFGPAKLVFAPVLGWMTYLALMWHWTGNAFQGFEAQAYWRAHSIANLWDVPKFVFEFFEPTSWHEFRGSVLDRCAFLMVLTSIPVLWRVGRDLLPWVVVLGVIPAMSGTFVSFIRFESVVFPVFVAFGIWAAGAVGRWRWLTFGVAAVLGVFHLILVWRFVNYEWAG